MKKKHKKNTEKPTALSAIANGNMGSYPMISSLYDPNGSWTGTPFSADTLMDIEGPEQDVDDL